MEKNIGPTDRIIRLIIACALFGYAIWQSSWIAAALGLFALYEAVASWCALYQLLGKNTCDVPPNNSSK